MCESFIIQTIQQVISREVEHPGIDTLLNYVSNVEKYNLTAALPHVVHLCAKYSIESLTRAAAKNRLSPEMLSQICIERVKAMDTLTKHKMEKGFYSFCLLCKQKLAMISKDIIKTVALMFCWKCVCSDSFVETLGKVYLNPLS